MQSCDLVPIITGPSSMELMTSNTSQQKLESLKGVWGGMAGKDDVSSQMQSESGHNYQMSIQTLNGFQFKEVDT